MTASVGPSTPIRRKLIEVSLPLEAINTEASLRKRKAPGGYPTSIHRWWAQRPIAACRAVLFASLIDDPSSDPDHFPTLKAQDDERQRLFEIIKELVKWEHSTDARILAAARAEIARSVGSQPPPLMDPFCGAGSIPLEAQRLGLAVRASDLNPVAVLITKSLVEIPANFRGQMPVHPELRRGVGGTGTWQGASGLADDVRRYGSWMRDEAHRRIGHLFPAVPLPDDRSGAETDVIAWLWARTVRCPNPACGARMPLVKSFALSTKKGRERWALPVIDRNARSVRFEISAAPPIAPKGTVDRRGARCIVCDTVVPLDHIKAEGVGGRMSTQLLAIVADGQGGRLYLPPNPVQLEAAASAEPSWRPEGEIAKRMTGGNCTPYGLTTWGDIFTDRQLVVLSTLSDLVSEARARVLVDATGAVADPVGYADAIATYLAFVVSRVADYGNSLASWRPKDSAMRALFARQAVPMVWDFAEGSPFGHSSSGINECVAVVARTLEHLAPDAPAVVTQADATESVDVPPSIVSTDPPYYDNIGYADLADFFYVWLRRSLSSVYPNLFLTLLTPKADELVATPYRFGGSKAKADEHFEEGLRSAFRRIRANASPDVPVTVYYAFKQAESDGDTEAVGPAIASTGWETMLEGLLGAGFSIGGTWPMRTEGDNRQVGVGTNALASSIVLVCRPRPDDARITDRRGFMGALKAELPEALRALQHGNIAPVDLAQAAIGPGMAIFSRYGKIVEPDGAPMTVRTALGIINSVLNEVLSDQEDEFDADTRWAVTWFEEYGHRDGKFGDAEVLSKAKNTGINALRAAGILVDGAGRVRLKRRDELDASWDPTSDKRLTVWEVCQYLIRSLDEGGESTAAELVRRVGGLADTARDLAYRLYSICERKKWADEALGYNALVSAWPEITRLAASAPGTESPRQTQLFS